MVQQHLKNLFKTSSVSKTKCILFKTKRQGKFSRDSVFLELQNIQVKLKWHFIKKSVLIESEKNDQRWIKSSSPKPNPFWGV